jgi:hypothetical protein
MLEQIRRWTMAVSTLRSKSRVGQFVGSQIAGLALALMMVQQSAARGQASSSAPRMRDAA